MLGEALGPGQAAVEAGVGPLEARLRSVVMAVVRVRRALLVGGEGVVPVVAGGLGSRVMPRGAGVGEALLPLALMEVCVLTLLAAGQ